MKLAFSTEDGNSISRHFGRASYYMVVEIDDGQVVSQQLRPKAGHSQFIQEEPHGHHEHEHDEHAHRHRDQGHGFGQRAQERHARMFTPIEDCDLVISGGMGAGAYQFLESKGLQPILTEIEAIPDAIQAYLQGNLKNRTEWLH